MSERIEAFNNSIWLVRAGFTLVATLCAGMIASWGMMIYDGVGTMTGDQPVAYQNFSDTLSHSLPYMFVGAALVYVIFFLVYREYVKTLDSNSAH